MTLATTMVPEGTNSTKFLHLTVQTARGGREAYSCGARPAGFAVARHYLNGEVHVHRGILYAPSDDAAVALVVEEATSRYSADGYAIHTSVLNFKAQLGYAAQALRRNGFKAGNKKRFNAIDNYKPLVLLHRSQRLIIAAEPVDQSKGEAFSKAHTLSLISLYRRLSQPPGTIP